MKKMKRLHKLTSEEIAAWREARLKVGQEKYGDSHLRRYGLVDVMEELLDAKNILELAIERLRAQGESDCERYEPAMELNWLLGSAIWKLLEADLKWPDSVCTDEEGGKRIWWPNGSEENASAG